MLRKPVSSADLAIDIPTEEPRKSRLLVYGFAAAERRSAPECRLAFWLLTPGSS